MSHILKLHYCFRVQRTVGRPSDKKCYHLHFAPEWWSAKSVVNVIVATTARVTAIHDSHLYPSG